jgi:hypothetical protein
MRIRIFLYWRWQGGSAWRWSALVNYLFIGAWGGRLKDVRVRGRHGSSSTNLAPSHGSVLPGVPGIVIAVGFAPGPQGLIGSWSVSRIIRGIL